MGNKVSAKRLRRLVERGDEANALRLIAEASNRNKAIDLGRPYSRHDGVTVLHLAALMGMSSLVALVLDADGVDVNAATTRARRTALHFVASPEKLVLAQLSPGERAELGRVRAALGAIVARGHEGGEGGEGGVGLEEAVAALPEDDQAVFERARLLDGANRHVLEALLAAPGINVNAATVDGVTALHQAAHDGYVYGMECLLATGQVDVNAVDGRGNTPLHQAAMRGFVRGVEVLLAAGTGVYAQLARVAVDARNAKGRTALEAAAAKGEWECVRALLGAGSSTEGGELAAGEMEAEIARVLDEVVDGGVEAYEEDGGYSSDGAPPETPAGLRNAGRAWAYRIHVSGSDGGSSDEEAGWSRSGARMSVFPHASDADDAAASASAGASGEREGRVRVRGRTEQLALDTEEIGDERDERVGAVVAALDVEAGAALALLQHMVWDVDATVAWYLVDPAAACEAVGVLNQEELIAARAAQAAVDACVICMDDLGGDEAAAAANATACEHAFCTACWGAYLRVEIESGGAGRVTCPGIGCGARVSDEMVRGLVDDATYALYNELKVQSFIDDNPRMKWCPAADCEVAVEAPVAWRVNDGGGGEEGGEGGELAPNVRDVECSAGHRWCFACLGPAHEPAACGMLRRWTEAVGRHESGHDEATERWLRNHAKPCPACGRMLVKTAGCNHFRCGGHGARVAGCGHEFCWLCLAPWAQHNSSVCSRNQRRVAAAVREGAAEFAVVQDERLEHAKVRVAAHELNGETEATLVASAATVMELLQRVMPERVSTYFYKLACDALVRARSAIRYSYVRQYFSQDGGLDTRAFEHSLATLERHAHALASILAIPYHAELHASRRANLHLLRFALFAHLSRARIWRLSTLVDSARRNLVEVAHNGHASVRHIATPSQPRGWTTASRPVAPVAAAASAAPRVHCHACDAMLPPTAFSNRQRRRSPRRCTACIVGNRVADATRVGSEPGPSASPAPPPSQPPPSDFEGMVSVTHRIDGNRASLVSLRELLFAGSPRASPAAASASASASAGFPADAGAAAPAPASGAASGSRWFFDVVADRWVRADAQ